MTEPESISPVALIVEDRPSSTFELLRGQPNVRFALDFKDAIEQLKTGEIDVIVTDLGAGYYESPSGRDDFTEVAKVAASLEREPPVLVVSSYKGSEKIPHARSSNTDELLKAIREAAHHADTLRLSRPLYEHRGSLVLPKSEIVRATWDFQIALESLSKNPRELNDLTPRQFEELVAGIWDRFGYEVELTSPTGDGGRDVIALRKSEAQVRFLIECKRYRFEHKVGVGLVRALLGVKTTERATKAILATTSTFTRPAQELFDKHLYELEGRDFDGLLEWIKMANTKV